MWLLKDISIFLVTNLCFFKFGSYYFENFLFKDFDIQRIPEILFSSTFSLSCTMFELIIFEIAHVMDPSSRFWGWKVCLFLILSLLVFIYPIFVFYLIFKPFLSSRPKVFAGAICCFSVIFLYLFWKLGDPFPLLTEQEGSLSIQMGIARIGIVGVTMMSCLSGFGAVEFPIQNMSYFARDISDYQIKSAQRQLLLNTDKILLKKKQLCLLLHQKDTNAEIKNQLKNEINNLETHNRLLFWDFDELNKAAERNRFSSTKKGRVYNLLGFFFSGYCGYKIFMASFNILFDRVSKKDPITNALELAFKWFQISLDVPFWSQHISFFLIGIMIATSIRGFLTKLISLFSHYSSRDTSTYIGLAFGQIMGMYFVSSILLIRMNLPEDYRRMLTNALGDIRFDFFHRWSDFIFIPSALLYLFWFAIIWKRKKNPF